MISTPFFILAAAVDKCQKGNDFFGLVPWYHYLEESKFDNLDNCNIKNFTFLPGPDTPSDIPLVLLAVVDDLLRIAGMVAVAFIIVGAIQYIISQGNSEQTSRAQSTIINAMIGLAIAIVSVAFISFLGNRLGG